MEWLDIIAENTEDAHRREFSQAKAEPHSLMNWDPAGCMLCKLSAPTSWGQERSKQDNCWKKYERCRRNSPCFILSSPNQINILATLMPIDSLPLWHVYRMSSSCSAGCVQGNAPAEHWRRGSQFSRSQGRATGVTRPTEHTVSSREWKILLWEKEDWKESSHLI